MMGLGVTRAGRNGALASIAAMLQRNSAPPPEDERSPAVALYDTEVQRYSMLYAWRVWPWSLISLPGALSRRLPLPENCSYLACSSSIRVFAYWAPSAGRSYSPG